MEERSDKGLDSGNILKIMPADFVNSLNVDCEKKRGSKDDSKGTSLMVQWLGLHAPNAGSQDAIPGQGTRSHMLQLGVHMLQLKDPTRGNEDPSCHN